jgi:cytoskeletal protein CcmA (bactofilin family)
MAIFGKDRERSDRSFTLPPVSAGTPESVSQDRERSRPMPDDAGSNAFLGKGSRITGKLSFEGPVRIEGHVDGEIAAQDTLTIGESAVVTAQIVGNAVVIHGKVTGDVTARKRLEIRAPGKLFGNIVTPSLVIHEGVVFEGQCTMTVPADAKGAKDDRKVTHLPKYDRADGGALREAGNK